MNKKQRRKRIARIRAQQKEAREYNNDRKKRMARNDFVDVISMVERFAREDKKFVEEYDLKLKNFKRNTAVLLVVSTIFNFAIYNGYNFVSQDWNQIFSLISIIIVIMPVVGYFIYRESLPFWKSQLEEHLRYLDELKIRLREFDSNENAVTN